MSRIGKQPVVIPAGVKIEERQIDDQCLVRVEGPKGKLSCSFRNEVRIQIEGDVAHVQRCGETAFHRAYHGTARALLANMVHGVAQGFEKQLEIEGVGYNAKVEGKTLVLQIGFCHPVKLAIPEGLTVTTAKPTQIAITGSDRQLVGEFAAQVRRIRPPEPYKGKGIRYVGEHIVRKAGKTFGSAS
jgi:large subunit ribosomal protein L6